MNLWTFRGLAFVYGLGMGSTNSAVLLAVPVAALRRGERAALGSLAEERGAQRVEELGQRALLVVHPLEAPTVAVGDAAYSSTTRSSSSNSPIER